jgi:hypothetical protein
MSKTYCTTPSISTGDGFCINYEWKDGKCIYCLTNELEAAVRDLAKVLDSVTCCINSNCGEDLSALRVLREHKATIASCKKAGG